MSVFETSVGLFLSITAAVLPTILYVLIIWSIDRYEKEPVRLLITAFLWGALPAVILTIILESLAEGPITMAFQEYSGVIGASFVAPVVEEGAKGLGLLTFFWLARSEFDDVLDGIVYGALIGFGFAMPENIKYFINAWQQGGIGELGARIVGRAMLFGFNHAMFTALTGIGFGLARYSKGRGKQMLLVLGSLGLAMFAHFLHNSLLALTDTCLFSFLVDWGGVLGVFLVILVAWQRERAWMQEELADEVTSGVLTPLQLETTISRRGRLKHEWLLLGISGMSQARLWGKLVNAATELAFKEHELRKMGEEKGNGKAIAALRQRILHIRAQLGDQAAIDSRICAVCGRPGAQDGATGCAYCGAPWPSGPVA